MTAPEGRPDHYAVEFRYDWGGMSVSATRFDEVVRFTIRERDDLDDEIERCLERMAKRHGFDCGLWDRPMMPIARSVKVTPVYSTETIYLDRQHERWMTNLFLCDELVRMIDARSDRKRERK